ncbi:MAG: HD domain-containing protein [Deltaproteobacteria bacterium]|nr:HD domain-containing protein [Deltaproteobacteria bacterium]MBW2020726.1 HD domain-containing protein [Deltaproteobacteria bacterium]MBW2075642.1 HD domain-containing protein [Deltaproteobacteria bacterium]RLB80574.1 MAG: phosphohydrolase [Deltaproteobacteria bacterium]
MNTKDLAYFKAWFSKYVGAYYTDDPAHNCNIRLKEEHTTRVCKEIVMLGKALRLSADDMLLAQTMALFHDIGRFQQYTTYGTFKDSISENHAKLGLKVLTKHKVLSVCSDVEQMLITKAIGYHNVRALPEDEDDRCLFFARLLRDADKLDIWRVVIDYYDHRDKTPNSTIELDLPNTSTYSPAILNALRQHRTADLKDMITLNDFKLLQISWIYDVNFNPTFRAVHERQYMEKIAATLPQTREISEVLAVVQAYLKEQKS